MPDFRIIVHMHHYFGDHRSSCRVFITSKIKTIENLKKHISNLFELREDYYLISNNLYLPNSEDVRVLREDDIVVVIPCDRRFYTNAVCSSKSEVTEFQNVSHDKAHKRRRNLFNESESESFEFQGLGVKKKKKSKHFEPETVSRTNNEFDDIENVSNEKKSEKNKKQKNYSFSEDEHELLISSNVKKEKQKNASKKGVKIDSDQTNNIFKANNNIEEVCDVDVVPQKKKKIKKKPNTDESLKNFELHSLTVNNSRKPFIIPRKDIKLMEISTKPKVIKSICVRDTPVNVNYDNVKHVSTMNVSSDNIYAYDSVRAMQTNGDKNSPDSVGSYWENDGNKKQLCRLKYFSTQGKIVKLPSEEICKSQFDKENQQVKYVSDDNKFNKIVTPSSLLFENNITAYNQDIDYKNMITSIQLQSNNTAENKHVNTNENVKIISIQTLDSEQNQTNNELLKNETIGPQLIPFSQQNTLTSVSNINENDNEYATSEMTPHSDLQTNRLPLHDQVECTAGFNEPTTTPSESIVSTITEESGVDLSLSFETKQKRKRVRKRKPKNKNQENVLFEAPVVYPKPVFTLAAPAIHIRFDNGNVIDPTENMSCEGAVADVVDINLNYDKLCQEEILEYPIMKNKLPKQGDVIAFKVCKLSDSYTPEISDVIIAKVLSYCSDTGDVFVQILEGADQCCTPEGKFYMENGDNNDEEEEKSFPWSDLIEPRLLFP